MVNYQVEKIRRFKTTLRAFWVLLGIGLLLYVYYELGVELLWSIAFALVVCIGGIMATTS